VSYRQIGLQHFNTSFARALALDTARQSLVLMKNTARALPVAPGLNIVAAGPGLLNDMLGDYHGDDRGGL
jgi:hypothetical protein